MLTIFTSLLRDRMLIIAIIIVINIIKFDTERVHTKFKWYF